MDIVKLQQDIIKNPIIWSAQEGEDDIYFTNGVFAFKCKKHQCMIDLSKLNKKLIGQHFNPINVNIQAESANILKRTPGITILKFRALGAPQEIWINSSYEKHFSKAETFIGELEIERNGAETTQALISLDKETGDIMAYVLEVSEEDN